MPTIITRGAASIRGFGFGVSGPSGPLVPGVTYTFTPYTKTGPVGTSQALANAYWASNPEILAALTVSNGIQRITLAAGTYTIDMLGGSGGATADPAQNTVNFNAFQYDNNIYGGVGARIQATFTLAAATTVNICVGQVGQWGQYPPPSSSANFGGGGGGATYIYLGTAGISTNPIAIAGGGGGAGGPWGESQYGGARRAFGGSANETSNQTWTNSSSPSFVYDVVPTDNYVDAFSGGSWLGTRNNETVDNQGYGYNLTSQNPFGGWVYAQPSASGPSGRPTSRDTESGTTVPRQFTIYYVPGTTIASQSYGGFGGGGAGYGNYGSGGGGGGYSGGAGFRNGNQTTASAVRAGGGGGSSYVNTSYLSGITVTGGDSIYNSTYYGAGYFKITKVA
jgi:hypothetical protein